MSGEPSFVGQRAFEGTRQHSFVSQEGWPARHESSAVSQKARDVLQEGMGASHVRYAAARARFPVARRMPALSSRVDGEDPLLYQLLEDPV